MEQHDRNYKQIFSEPLAIQDLLTGFVHEAWINELDFRTLERVNTSFISEDLQRRESDVIWRVRFGTRWLYVYLLLEFQSSIDHFMAVRMMTYIGLLYQDLIKQGRLTATGKLPPVLPMVLYNGQRKWQAADNIAELIASVPGGLEHYRPHLHYLLLDEQAIVADKDISHAAKNVAAAIFHLEYSRNGQDALAVLQSLATYLQDPAQSSLRRALVVWLKRVILPKIDADDPQQAERWHSINELEEATTMLAEQIEKEWPKKWIEQGIEQGLEQGREEAALRIAHKMIRETQLTDQHIAQLSGLSLAQIRKLRRN